jgi:hypothetical protein
MDSQNFESQLNMIPKWEDLVANDLEEEKEILQNVFRKMQYENAKIVYKNWLNISTYLFAFSAQEFRKKLDIQSRNFIDDVVDNMQTSIYEIPSTVYSAAFSESYIIQMENAAFIRWSAINIETDLKSIAMFANIDEMQKQVFKDLFTNFKIDFKNWVYTFKKDDYEDEWGLF